MESVRARRGLLHCGNIFGDRKYRDSRTEDLEEVAPSQSKPVHGKGAEFVAFRLKLKEERFPSLAHFACSCFLPAAFWTAAMIRGFLPPQQRCTSAATTPHALVWITLCVIAI